MDDSACQLLSYNCQQLPLHLAFTCLLPCVKLVLQCCSCDESTVNACVKPHLLAGTTSTLYVVSGFRLDTITLRDFTLCGDGSLLAPAAGRTSTAGTEKHTMKR
jgi:hypothetical protein